MRDIHETMRRADFARARTLAEHGFVVMAREIIRQYHPDHRPQIVAEVGVVVSRQTSR